MLLRSWEQQGKIQNLQLQVPFELIPNYRIDGKTVRGVKYVADFVYLIAGKKIVEDAKGMRTDVYKLKKKMVYDKYKIVIQEV